MPLYVWGCKKSGKKVEILRSFTDYQSPPTEEEAVASGFTEEEAAAAEYEKHLGTGIKVVRGANWQGSKGNW